MDNEIQADRPELPQEGQEFKGKSLEDAVSYAEHILKTPREEFNYEIVAEKTKLFGIKSKEIVIRVWPKRPPTEDKVGIFLEEFKKVFPLELTYQLRKKNEILFVIFSGEDKHMLLRKEGSLLLALQHVLNKISDQKVQVDCDFFRKKKERKLWEYAQQIARQVQDTGRNEVLDLMNPYERRIIHLAANQVNGITTESLGDGFLKRVKIYPVPKPSRQADGR
jgi:spoIIIJ-associated protein